MKKILSLSVLAIAFILLTSCSGDENPQSGSIEIEFDNVVGEDDLTLNTTDEVYTNAAGETFKVTMLRYYISNIILTREDGSTYHDEVTADGSKGYYLVDEANTASQLITLNNVPAGSYTSMTFTIGVDANRVTEGAQTGALDVANDMFWSWNSGYIFLKFEGISAASTEENKAVMYHVGGYKTIDTNPSSANNVKTKTVTFTAAKVASDKTPEVHMIVDVLKIFASPNQISFAAVPVQMSPKENIPVVENYLNTFIADHVHN
jgi:hypothetical protein